MKSFHLRYPECSGVIKLKNNMTNIIKVSLLSTFFAFGVFAMLPSTVIAWGSGDYGGGCCDNGGSGDYSPPPSDYSPPTPPSCVLGGAPASIQKGQSATLSWTSSLGMQWVINQGIGHVAASGSRIIAPTQTTTYTLTVTAHNGQIVQCVKTITVTTPPPLAPKPSCAITANPHNVQYGGSSTLSWTSSNATSAAINQGIGSVAINGSRAVNNLIVTKTYTLTVTGPGGTANCYTTITVTQAQTPSCTISANPSSVQYGGSSTLTWTSSNATSASINQSIGSVALNGSRAVSNLITTKTYTLTVTGPGGSANCQTTITVTQQQVPSCTITINPHNVQYGGSATITWTSQNATSATLTDFGSEAVSGSRTVSNITANKTYVLNVTGPGGSAHCQDTVVVEQSQVPSCTINANPSSLQYGGSSTLTWTSSNATSATINHGIGSVGVNGSYTVSNIYTTKTYAMTVYGPGGSATCQTTIYVSEIPSTPSCALNSNPSSVQQGGSSYLSWTSQNAISATLSSVGSVGVNGNYTVYPSNTTTYILTVYSAQGQSAQCQTTVYVGTIYNNPPTCWITLTPQYGYGSSYYNQAATLSWGSTNATSAYINPSIGSVSTSGSRTVYTDNYVTYTMTVYNSQGQSATCQTQSTYVPPVYYPPQVALTQIPYTGLDLGTTDMVLYYLALLSFALAAGYLIVYYVPAFAGLKARIPAETMEAPMIFARSVAASVPFARASRSDNGSDSVFKDSMVFARSENGSTPRIVIQRN